MHYKEIKNISFWEQKFSNVIWKSATLERKYFLIIYTLCSRLDYMDLQSHKILSFDGLGTSPSRPTSAPVENNLANVLPKQDPNLMRIIRSIASTNSIQVKAALNELNEILECPEKQAALRDYKDMYVDSILAQFKILSQLPLNESLVLYQPILSSSYSFFFSRVPTNVLGKNN